MSMNWLETQLVLIFFPSSTDRMDQQLQFCVSHVSRVSHNFVQFDRTISFLQLVFFFFFVYAIDLRMNAIKLILKLPCYYYYFGLA